MIKKHNDIVKGDYSDTSEITYIAIRSSITKVPSRENVLLDSCYTLALIYLCEKSQIASKV